MTEQNQTPDARMSDPGRKPGAMSEALSGSDMGSDTRAGSLQGGASTGSDIDPDQATINEALAGVGVASANPQSPATAAADPVNKTGADPTGTTAGPVGGKSGEADAAAG